MLTTDQVYDLLEVEYGHVSWKPRYDPVSELVFTILSQHTSDINAERAFARLTETFGAWEDVAEASPNAIAVSIRIGGLSRIKAPRIKATLQRIQELRGAIELSFLGELPLDQAKSWLRQLPGVGPKSAAVVLAFAMGMPAFPVDTHIHRVARRLGIIGPKVNAEDAHELLEGKLSPEHVYAFHVYLITHGRRVCKARRPYCNRCALAFGCPSRCVSVSSDTACT